MRRMRSNARRYGRRLRRQRAKVPRHRHGVSGVVSIIGYSSIAVKSRQQGSALKAALYVLPEMLYREYKVSPQPILAFVCSYVLRMFIC